MVPPTRRLVAIRAAERFCLERGVDALSLAAVGESVAESRGAIAELFQDETTLLDAILERHQVPYEQSWEALFPELETPRAAIRMLVASLAALVHDDDGGPAYIAVAAQMCNSARFPLTGRPATTTPAALRLMGLLTTHSQVPFELMPLHFERFAAVLFGSVFAWYRHGAARVPDAVFIEDLVDHLEALALARPSAATERALAL